MNPIIYEQWRNNRQMRQQNEAKRNARLNFDIESQLNEQLDEQIVVKQQTYKRRKKD